MKRGIIVFLVWLVGGVAVLVASEAARVEVATLDGEPVYHWRAFESVVRDDVDRALILREFKRRGYSLPPKLVDDAVRQTVTKDADGDTGKFTRNLRRKGASMDDFRLFASEEIALTAMMHQESEDKKKREQWLARLRNGVVVKRVPASKL